MTKEPLSWHEGSELVNELGNEKWLGKRVQTERKLRGWSQSRLSAEMGKAGQPLQQSAISKIEPLDEHSRGGRPRAGGSKRSVTIGEAIGLSKVFSIPLGELLLPPEVVRDVAAWQGYLEAVEVQGQIMHQRVKLEEILDTIEPVFAASEPLRRRLVEHRTALMEHFESRRREQADREIIVELDPVLPPGVLIIDEIIRTLQP